MRSKQVSSTTTAASLVVPLSREPTDGNTRYAVELSGTGTRVVQVEYTIESLVDNSAGGVTWFSHSSANMTSAASYSSSLPNPLTGIRCVGVSGNGAASIIFTVLQGGY